MQLLVIIRFYGCDEALRKDSDIIFTCQYLFYSFDSFWFSLLDGSCENRSK